MKILFLSIVMTLALFKSDAMQSQSTNYREFLNDPVIELLEHPDFQNYESYVFMAFRPGSLSGIVF